MGLAVAAAYDDARGVSERTPEEHARSATRRLWARAIARGLALGAACAVLEGWTVLLVHLLDRFTDAVVERVLPPAGGPTSDVDGASDG